MASGARESVSAPSSESPTETIPVPMTTAPAAGVSATASPLSQRKSARYFPG
jgi:hypothetical protein